MFGWFKRLLWGSQTPPEENPVPDQPMQQHEPEPVAEPVAPPAPALSPLMQRVKVAQDANDIDALRRFRWCFHEAAHAVVGHYNKATVSAVLVNVAVGSRPRAIIGKESLKRLADAVKNHGGGSQQACDAAVTFFAEMAAGELMDHEVQPAAFPPLSTKLNAQVWDNYIADPPQTDMDTIVMMARGAGLKNRTELVQAGESRATEIITEKRASFEVLVTHLHDIGNIEGKPLQDILNM